MKTGWEKRFWAKVRKTSTCWLWTGAHQPNGYGSFQNEVAHRVSFRMHYGKINSGKVICHKCDVKSCVRPDHLFEGTSKDNSHDYHQKRYKRDEAKSAGKDFDQLNAPDVKKENRLMEVHARFLKDDIDHVKKIAAEKGIPYQIELRMIVRRALRDAMAGISILKERP